MQRIGGRLRSRGSGLGGANLGIPPLARLSPNRGPDRLSEQWQVGSLTGAVASSVGRPGGNARGKSGYMLGSPSSSPEAPPALDEEV